MLTVDEASRRIRDKVGRLGSERVALDATFGRVLAADAVSSRTLPPHDNSAMDGFAVRAADTPGTLPIAGVVAAGATPGQRLEPGTALRIMTGAPVPDGADSIIMRENASVRGDEVAFAEPAILARHIRRRGEDIGEGDVVLTAGTRLGPGEIGVLAALGFAEVEVARRPKVALLSTGDELVDVGQTPGPGQIVNSNAYALGAQVRAAGGEPVNVGIAPDDRDRLVHHLLRGLEADVLCTSGGVSVGDYDFVKEAFETVGVALDFWKVAMKPGKPLAFGLADGGVPVFGLPGNPVSSMVVFELFVRPALRAMQGAREVDRPRARVTLSSAYRKKPGRAHYVRAHLERRGAGLVAHPHTKQGSHMLSSMIAVDALVVVPADAGDVAAGTELDALLLEAA